MQTDRSYITDIRNLRDLDAEIEKMESLCSEKEQALGRYINSEASNIPAMALKSLWKRIAVNMTKPSFLASWLLAPEVLLFFRGRLMSIAKKILIGWLGQLQHRGKKN